MQRLSVKEIRKIARKLGIRYSVISDPDPLTVRTRMSKAFNISRESMFSSFSDPMAHVPLFSIIKSSTPPIRYGIHDVLPENEFFVFEHIEEGELPPRIMLVKYTLNRPLTIKKEAVTNPFDASRAPSEGGEEGSDVSIQDRKKGRVVMKFTKKSEKTTRLTTTSVFHAKTGEVFSREFIDTVWLNFYERMMVISGELREEEMRTGRMR